ncbi:MAG: toll/interleukin-1 receptor domain-containing protein [Allosphingosinicella sp.]
MIQGFISYAHYDRKAFEKMLVRIKTIERALSGQVDFWADSRMHAGDYWTDRVGQAIEHAQVHLLLISAEFLASDYIARHELPAINAKYLAGDLVIPIVLSGCLWEPFVGPLQAVPTFRGRVLPICDWSRRENGFHTASWQVLEAIKAHFGIVADAGLDWHRDD